jgi:hypothetical protein
MCRTRVDNSDLNKSWEISAGIGQEELGVGAREKKVYSRPTACPIAHTQIPSQEEESSYRKSFNAAIPREYEMGRM